MRAGAAEPRNGTIAIAYHALFRSKTMALDVTPRTAHRIGQAPSRGTKQGRVARLTLMNIDMIDGFEYMG